MIFGGVKMHGYPVMQVVQYHVPPQYPLPHPHPIPHHGMWNKIIFNAINIFYDNKNG